jgi:glycosyltransferase involved in cell wall biosynthesis
MKLKIAIVVHGRFHAFDLARALLQREHDVVVFTNYPKWAVKRFDFPENRVRSYWEHGILSRAISKLERLGIAPDTEAWVHTMFSRWAAGELIKDHWDVVHPWSGVSEEILNALAGKSKLNIMARLSSHIRTQARLLEEEEKRTGSPQEKPSAWIIDREEREYAKADKILVLSSFSRDSFIAEGVDPEKVLLMPTCASLKSFRPSPEVIEERCRRILSDRPLQVMYVGTLCFRKGLDDIIAILKSLNASLSDKSRFHFRFIGPVAAEAKKHMAELKNFAELIPKRPQHELPKWYAQGDLFIFPSIEEGLPQVLAQANASGLPIITTTNSGAANLIQDNETGWILPIRSPEKFIKRLIWSDEHREDLAAMVRRAYNDFKPRDWTGVAAQFESICLNAIENVEKTSRN